MGSFWISNWSEVPRQVTALNLVRLAGRLGSLFSLLNSVDALPPLGTSVCNCTEFFGGGRGKRSFQDHNLDVLTQDLFAICPRVIIIAKVQEVLAKDFLERERPSKG